MYSIAVREARNSFSELLDEAEQGGVVSILRRGKEVARIVPPETKSKGRFPDLSEFRNGIKTSSGTGSKAVVEGRDEERY